MLSPDSTMEEITVKTDSSAPSNSTELCGLLDEVSSRSPIKPDPDQPPAEYLVSSDKPKDVLSPKVHTIGEKLWTDTSGLPYQVPVTPHDDANPYHSGDVILNDPLKPEPDERSAEHWPSVNIKAGLSNALHDVVKTEESNDDSRMPSMDTNDSCDPKCDDVEEDSTKILTGEQTLAMRPTVSGTVNTRTDAQLIGISTPSTSAPRENSFEPLPPIIGEPDKPLHTKKTPGKRPFACNECNYRAGRASHLKLHMSTHTGEKPFACSLCNYRAACSSQVKVHMRSHTGEKPYECTECGYRTDNSYRLKRHIIRSHFGEKSYACNLCSYKAAEPLYLTSHMRTHTGEKPYACDQCNYRTADSSHFKSHMRKHTGEKPFACNVCSYRAARANTLKAHMATHTGEKPFACNFCNFRTASCSHLKSHMRSHTGEKPYACTECSYRATQASNLKAHMATHTGNKPFTCNLCSYKTADSSHLKSHMRTHTGEKPYACTECNYRATLFSSLRLHMEKHHYGKETLKDYSCVPHGSGAGIMSSDTESTSLDASAMLGRPHFVNPAGATDAPDPHEQSGDISLRDPFKPDPDEPSAEGGSSCSMASDLHRSDPLLDQDKVKTEVIFEGDTVLSGPLEINT